MLTLQTCIHTNEADNWLQQFTGSGEVTHDKPSARKHLGESH